MPWAVDSVVAVLPATVVVRVLTREVPSALTDEACRCAQRRSAMVTNTLFVQLAQLSKRSTHTVQRRK